MNYFIWGIITGLVIIWLKFSIKIPKQNQVRGITRFGRIVGFMANIDGKSIYYGPTTKKIDRFELVDENLLIKKSSSEESNIYLIPWPIYKEYEYPLTYVKAKRKGEETVGDRIIWEFSDGRDILVSRTNTSNHLLFRSSYPIITNDLETKDMGKVRILTENVIELTNPMLAYTGIDNWMSLVTSILDGALRGIVSKKTIEELNLMSTGDIDDKSFNQMVTNLVNGRINDDPKNPKLKLGDIGFKLVRSIYKDFEPIGEETEKMLAAIRQETIAKKIGLAEIAKAEAEAQVVEVRANAEAKAHITVKEAEISMKKKEQIDTGRAKANEKGEINELVPEANIKATSDAVAELSKVTGTLVLGGDMLKTLNINKE